MKLSKRGEYALRALIDLGIAQELGRPILQVSELAAKEKLPVKFLEQIFAQLKLGEFVKSTRGKLGGYSLAKPMTRIRFGTVIRLIDGPLAPIQRPVGRTGPIHQGRSRSDVVSSPRLLHLHHVGSKVREQERAIATRKQSAQVKDEDALQGPVARHRQELATRHRLHPPAEPQFPGIATARRG